MSSSIDIPASRSAKTEDHNQSPKGAATSSSSSSYSSSPRTSPEKRKVMHHRRPSLLSSALSKEECAVINIGDPDGSPRLISYQISGQGFVWNPEIFLPSYVDCEYTPLENRREPVHEIFLSDEEIKNMLPQ